MRSPILVSARRVLLVALAAFVLMPVHTVAQPATDKLDPLLQVRSRQLTGRSRVIVEFRGTPDPRVITRRGGVAGRQLPELRAQVANVENHELETLARDPRVARVVPDRETFATLERAGAAIGAEIARRDFGLTGRGVGIAVIDSGVWAWHNDLTYAGGTPPRVSRRVVHFKDFTRDVSPTLWFSDSPSDDYGHGTHVAGIISGSGFDSNGARSGIAPRANIVALKVLDGEGRGYVSDVIEAIDYAIAIRNAYNIRVINLSVATGVFESYTTDALAQATKRAVDAGIVVVASAGNLGTNQAGEPQFGGITCPGNAPWVLTVGAANHRGTTRRRDDLRASFSSMGPTWIDFAAKPDVLAYGVGIESLAAANSTLYGAYPQYLVDGSRSTAFKPYLSLSGTSMAAPVVAGTVALMIEANPALTPNAVKALLQYTAQVRKGEHFLGQGAGILNARGAVRMARFFARPDSLSPEPAKDTIGGETIAWSRRIIWGNVRVGGGVPLPGSSAWGKGVTWGAARTADGRPVAWGLNTDDNIVWSTLDDNIVWSTSDENIVWSTNDENIVWSTSDAENIVWSTTYMQNVVWGRDCRGVNCQRTLWGSRGANGGVWGTAEATDNIVWSTNDVENIVWSTNGATDDNIVWSTGDNIVWSTNDDNIVWSTNDDNIVWSTGDENIVWSTGLGRPEGPPAVVDNRRDVPASR